MNISRASAVAALLFSCILSVSATNEVGKAFLEENKKREGVVTLKSGLQYKVLKKGTGKFHPKKDTTCSCHYAGTTPSLTPDAIDKPEAEWKEFDSSYKRGSPTSFAPNQVIKGWTEAMQLMVEGDKWEMYIPSELGYGDGGSGDKIKGGDVLIFRMEILEIQGAKVRAFKCDLKSRENCEPDELELLDEWVPKLPAELQAEIKSLSTKLEGTLKSGIREKLAPKLKFLKRIQKARAKQEL
eukprot:TRINITY_DN3244_c1_g2_i1.p1 TRINITY_DN3244_c1_g2~~TRINITY_DN3244_c1_g2_i1.p1  ORF type:complete len:264 (+),score=60.34 TRINITY_DN3244_c1_g2_i1:70-792(+)